MKHINSRQDFPTNLQQLSGKVIESKCFCSQCPVWPLDLNLPPSDPSFAFPNCSCRNKGSHRNTSVETPHLCLCLKGRYKSGVPSDQSAHSQRWAPCCVWSERSTLKQGWSRNKSGWRMWGINYFTWNPCWKDMASVPAFSLESAQKLHTSLFVESQTVPLLSLIWNTSQINTSPFHWGKTIQPVQSSNTRDYTGLPFSLCHVAGFCWHWALLKATVCINASIIKKRLSYWVRLG